MSLPRLLNSLYLLYLLFGSVTEQAAPLYLLFPQASLFSIVKFVLCTLVGHGVAVVGCCVATVVGAMFEEGTIFVFEKFHIHVRFCFFLLSGFLKFMIR